ncbi:hypothetical protein BKA62DRAFT_671355 [Auriculariales sp. MPI-PUGE-AT-0066]|nr:hypothetical protein BKA62DRAFT_671355 [Auriculariales sp. MPI-PUGE-AT-0066]
MATRTVLWWYIQWVQGSVYSGISSTFSYVRTATTAFNKPASLLEDGKIAIRPRPQYETYDASQLRSELRATARPIIPQFSSRYCAVCWLQDHFFECVGSVSGRTDLSDLQFLSHGTYFINSTITIQADSQIISEEWSQIMGYGKIF